MSSSNADTGECSSVTTMPPIRPPRRALNIIIADDNARGHQSPQGFEIVQGNTKKQQLCVLSDCPVMAVCRWGTSDCSTQKQRSSACSSSCRTRDSSTSSSCLPKRPTRRRADSEDLDAEELDTDSNHSVGSTASSSSCSSTGSSSSSGDAPLRRPRRQSSPLPEKRCFIASSEAASMASTSARSTSCRASRFETAITKNDDDGPPPLMLWSRSYTSSRSQIAAGAQAATPRFLSAHDTSTRRRKQVFSQSA